MIKGSIVLVQRILIAFLFCLLPQYALAQSAQPLTLEDCIKRALQFSPEVAEARYDVDVYRAKKLQADSHAYPQIEVVALAGPSPRAKQEQLIPSINTDVGLTINGIFGGIDISVIQPLYSFGKLGHYQTAAQSGIKASSAGVNKKKADIVLRIKELYNGILFAQDLRNLLLELREDIARSIAKAEKQIADDAPWADEVNIYKLKTLHAEITRNLNEADKSLEVAKSALKANIGMDVKDDIVIADTRLSTEARLPELLDVYYYKASIMRPEYTQVSEGIKAKQSLLEAERTSYYPQIFLGLMATIHGSTNRDRIKNPYIVDFFNQTKGAAFVGMKWGLDFGITKARILEAEAEHRKMLEKERFVKGAIPVQIKKAYLELQESFRNIKETERAVENSKKWLVIAMANFDMGLGEAKEIAEAAKSYALSKANYLMALYNQRQAFASLNYAAGLDIQDQ